MVDLDILLKGVSMLRINWTDEELGALSGATSLHAIADHAVAHLTRLAAMGEEVVQLCGPMSTGGLGCLERNMERFAAAVLQLHEAGYLVFNQIPLQDRIIVATDHHAGGPYCMDILEILYRRIFESGHVVQAFFLPDWQSSTGARWEYDFVQRCGIGAADFPLVLAV